MAGLVGIYSKKEEYDFQTIIDKMVKEISYIDEDKSDHYVHRACGLARVYHGNEDSGEQPFFNATKTMCCIMSGEIFDTDSEKSKFESDGYKFHYANNNAEFCLAMYQKYGKDAFIKLNGNFLIVLYDIENDKILIVNDRFSSIPLFYTNDKESIAFGTQVRPLLAKKGCDRDLDGRAILEFFRFQMVFEDKTYLNNIKILEPGHLFEIHKGTIDIRKYWHPDYSNQTSEKLKTYANEFEACLRDAVSRRTQSKGTYGLLLSGGMDARAILALCPKKIKTYTIGDFVNKEVATAKRIAEQMECEHQFLKRSIDHYVDIIEKAVDIGDGMYSFQHAHFIGFLDSIRDDCDVLLHGYGFDIYYKGVFLPKKRLEVFGKRQSLPFIKKFDESDVLAEIYRLSYCLQEGEIKEFFQDDFYRAHDGATNNTINNILNHQTCRSLGASNQMDYFINWFPYRHYSFLNNICLRNFAQERMVALDNNLYDLHYKIPPKYLANAKVMKIALGNINKEIAMIPDANSNLPVTAPVMMNWLGNVWSGLKYSYAKGSQNNPLYNQLSWPNLKRMIVHNQKMAELLEEIIIDEKCLDNRIFDKDAIFRAFDDHRNGRREFSWFFYLLITFGMWHKKYIAN